MNKYQEIIYVGKTKNIKNRMASHKCTKIDEFYLKNSTKMVECISNIHTIEYITLRSEFDMCMYEIYYINKFQPKYNDQYKYPVSAESEIVMKEPCEWNVYNHDSYDIENESFTRLIYLNPLKNIKKPEDILTNQRYRFIIEKIRLGFSENGVVFRKNDRIATFLEVVANTGTKTKRLLSLRLNMLEKHNDNYIYRTENGDYIFHRDVYDLLVEYADRNKISHDAKLFDISDRVIQQQLRIVGKTFNIINITPDSFRKYFATQIYINNNYNIQLVSQLLQHSSVVTTQKYIGIQQKDIEDALNKHIHLL